MHGLNPIIGLYDLEKKLQFVVLKIKNVNEINDLNQNVLIVYQFG